MSGPTLHPAVDPAAPRPLDAVPHHMPDIQARPDSRGRLHLRRDPAPPRNKLGALLRRIPGAGRPIIVSLDENGTAFWSLVDGRRDLAEIASCLTARLNLSEDAAREAVILFSGMLVTRHFLALEIPRPRDTP